MYDFIEVGSCEYGVTLSALRVPLGVKDITRAHGIHKCTLSYVTVVEVDLSCVPVHYLMVNILF